MHELAVTEGVVDAVTGRLPDARITCVRLEIGALSGVVADSVRFCFDLVTEGTNLEGARLEISGPPGPCDRPGCGGHLDVSPSRTSRSRLFRWDDICARPAVAHRRELSGCSTPTTPETSAGTTGTTAMPGTGIPPTGRR